MFLFCLFLSVEILPAENCSILDSDDKRLMGEAIAVVSDGTIKDRVIEKAVALWQTCPAYATDFPGFRVGDDETSFRKISVTYQKIRINPGDRKSCGWFSGNAITLFGYVRTAKGDLLHCGTLAQNLAHELGHVLGLADAPEIPECSPYIMSDMDSDNLYRRSVTAQECRAIASRWLRAPEDRLALKRRPPGSAAVEP